MPLTSWRPVSLFLTWNTFSILIFCFIINLKYILVSLAFVCDFLYIMCQRSIFFFQVDDTQVFVAEKSKEIVTSPEKVSENWNSHFPWLKHLKNFGLPVKFWYRQIRFLNYFKSWKLTHEKIELPEFSWNSRAK